MDICDIIARHMLSRLLNVHAHWRQRVRHEPSYRLMKTGHVERAAICMCDTPMLIGSIFQGIGLPWVSLIYMYRCVYWKLYNSSSVVAPVQQCNISFAWPLNRALVYIRICRWKSLGIDKHVSTKLCIQETNAFILLYMDWIKFLCSKGGPHIIML